LRAASVRVNEWLLTEEAVLGLLRINHEPLRESGYTHTNFIDRRTVVYNKIAASVDAIWSRCWNDNTEIERLPVHSKFSAATTAGELSV
jgi:hypothetical protein